MSVGVRQILSAMSIFYVVHVTTNKDTQEYIPPAKQSCVGLIFTDLLNLKEFWESYNILQSKILMVILKYLQVVKGTAVFPLWNLLVLLFSSQFITDCGTVTVLSNIFESFSKYI